MKKIISLLVVLAMLMAMAPAVLATGIGTYEDPYVYEVIGEIPAYFDLEPGQTIWIQAPLYGASATLTNADEFAGISIMHPMTGFPMVIADCWGGSVTTVLNSSNTPFSGDIADPIIIGITNQNPYVATSAALSVSFDSGNQGGGSADSIPNGGELALGDNNVTLTHAMMPMEASNWTYTPAEDGELTVTVTSINGNNNLGMAFGRGAYTLLAGESDGMWTNTVTVSVNANEPVRIAVVDTNDLEPVPAVINLSFVSQSGSGEAEEDLNAQYQGSGTVDDPYIIDEIPVNLGVTLTPMANDLYFQYTVTEAGVISFGESNATTWPIVNGEWNYNSNPVQVAVGDVVVFNIFDCYTNVYVPIEFEAGATLPEGGDQGGGGESTDPEGSITNPYVIDEMPYTVTFFGGMDLYYTYIAPADGVITANKFEGAILSCSHDYVLNDEDTLYTIAVAAGDEVTLNPWTMEAEISGDMTFEFTPAGGNQPSSPSIVEEGTASAEEDIKYTVLYTPEFNGTLAVTVGNGNSAWVSDVMDFDTFATIPGATGTAEDTYTIDVVAGTTYCVRIYGEGEPCAAISGIPYSIVFTPSGAAVGPQLEDWVESPVELPATGTVDVTVEIDTAITTLFNYKPAAVGTYKIELVSGNVEMSLWSTASYSKIMDAENGVLTVNITDVNQDCFIALAGEEAAAQIKITKTGDAPIGPSYDTIVYENEQTPIEFDDSEYEVDENVNVDDEKVDTAVLGADGYYHLNSADGPILYVDFFGTEPSIGAAWGYGQVSFAHYNGDQLISVINYQDALGEYLMAQNNEGMFSYGNKFHPLTDDLIEMLQNVGENNGWYGENGLVGDSEDAWMFSCVTMIPVEGEDAPEEKPEQKPENEAETKLEIIEGGITEVPETLVEAGLKTPEAVKDALVEALLAANDKNNKDDVAHYDVVLMFKDGDKWVKADETHFPENGKLTVTLPYPEGTDSSYTFTVAHMFTSDAFGKKPGDIETPKVTNTKDGIQFEVTGLSPISVSWVAPQNAQTGDFGVVAAGVAMAMSAICGTAVIVGKKKEF